MPGMVPYLARTSEEALFPKLFGHKGYFNLFKHVCAIDVLAAGVAVVLPSRDPFSPSWPVSRYAPSCCQWYEAEANFLEARTRGDSGRTPSSCRLQSLASANYRRPEAGVGRGSRLPASVRFSATLLESLRTARCFSPLARGRMKEIRANVDACSQDVYNPLTAVQFRLMACACDAGVVAGGYCRGRTAHRVRGVGGVSVRSTGGEGFLPYSSSVACSSRSGRRRP